MLPAVGSGCGAVRRETGATCVAPWSALVAPNEAAMCAPAAERVRTSSCVVVCDDERVEAGGEVTGGGCSSRRAGEAP